MAQKILTLSAGGLLTEINDAYQGTVTSVAALTLGTTGTDLSSTVAGGTGAAVITLQVPTASASNRGVLSSTDWSTFNGKYTPGTSLTLSGSSSVTFFLNNTSSKNWLMNSYTDGALHISVSGSADAISIDGTTFATTFVSIVAGGAKLSASSPIQRFYTTYGNTDARNWMIAASSQAYGDFVLRRSTALGGDPETAGAAVLSFDYLGAATFASSVQSTTHKVTSAGGYISSDNSTGITTTVTTASLVGKTLTIKDGIITGFA